MFWMLLGYIVTKVCTSPRILTWFTRPFLLMRGWGLETRLDRSLEIIATIMSHGFVSLLNPPAWQAKAPLEGEKHHPCCSFVLPTEWSVLKLKQPLPLFLKQWSHMKSTVWWRTRKVALESSANIHSPSVTLNYLKQLRCGLLTNNWTENLTP